MNNGDKGFKATTMIGSFEDISVDVVDFGGTMAVCGTEEGPTLITKEQAMEFFGLVEADRSHFAAMAMQGMTSVNNHSNKRL